jgi:hypothetical protein
MSPTFVAQGRRSFCSIVYVSLALSTAEVRNVDPNARAFSPFKTMMDAELRRYSERPLDLQPTIDAAEAILLAVFLRRYVRYCARRRRFAAMNGAARLYAEISAFAR